MIRPLHVTLVLLLWCLVSGPRSLESWQGRPVQLCTGTAKQNPPPHQPSSKLRQSLTGQRQGFCKTLTKSFFYLPRVTGLKSKMSHCLEATLAVYCVSLHESAACGWRVSASGLSSKIKLRCLSYVCPDKWCLTVSECFVLLLLADSPGRPCVCYSHIANGNAARVHLLLCS